MNAADSIRAATRERVVVLVCAGAALGTGAVVAWVSHASSLALLLVAFFGVLAFVLPRAWLSVALIVLIPLQFYFPLTEAFYLRGALVFVAAATLRVGLSGRASSCVLRPASWWLPAALFLAAATIAAFGATNRYAAFKGIYDWLPIFATAFVIGATTPGAWRVRVFGALVIVGAAEALLGLLQTRVTPTQIAEVLQRGVSQWFYPPNLLRERLADFSFNWVMENRVLPFGTFINGIDYALFLAAVLALALAWLLDVQLPRFSLPGFGVQSSTPRVSGFMLCVLAAVLIGVTLLQTLKGSAWLALVGAGAILAWAYGARFRASPGALVAGLGVLVLLGAIFFEPLMQRGAFLLQRERSESYETGRLKIWGQLFAALPQRPFFGFGLNQAGELLAPTQSLRGGTFIVTGNSPESAYVAALVETGIVGFSGLVGFIGVVLARAFRRARQSPLSVGVLAALAALLVGNLTVSALTTDQNGLLLGVLIGMVFANDERAHV